MERKEFIKKEISMGELIGAGVMILTICIGFYINTLIELSNHQLRIQTLEKQKGEDAQRLESEFKKTNDKIDHMIDIQTQIQIQLQNKVDKK